MKFPLFCHHDLKIMRWFKLRRAYAPETSMTFIFGPKFPFINFLWIPFYNPLFFILCVWENPSIIRRVLNDSCYGSGKTVSALFFSPLIPANYRWVFRIWRNSYVCSTLNASKYAPLVRDMETIRPLLHWTQCEMIICGNWVLRHHSNSNHAQLQLNSSLNCRS